MSSSSASKSVLWDWITTVDHKKIGVMYALAAFFFLIFGGVEALLMRTQLLVPDNEFLSARTFNTMVTMHGTTMIFLFVMPLSAAFFNYLTPLMIGARDVALPTKRPSSLEYKAMVQEKHGMPWV